MKKPLKIVFMGTPEFAVASLDKLHNSEHKVIAVITAPDRPAGRGKKLRQSAVKEYATNNNIDILQPTNLKDEAFIENLKSYNADLYVVVAFRMLPKIVWDMPIKGTINLHGSLLPEYRGAAPINWAVINGDTKTGVTSFFINEKIDTGKVILQEEIIITNTDTAGDLHDKMMFIGAETLLKTLDLISDGSIESRNQLWNNEYKPAPKIFKKDCLIDWNKDAESIYNLVRGLSPYPTAYTRIINNDGLEKNLKIFFAEISGSSQLEAGEIRIDTEEGLRIGSASNDLIVKDLQLEGKKRMEIESFLRGFQVKQEWKTA